MKILIVDGSKDRRRDLTDALAVLDNVVVQGAVPDVRTALHALADVSPDVVVTDVTLPDGDGTYLMERMRGLQRTPAVIVLASRGTEEQRMHYLSAGAESYVSGHDVAGVRAAVLGLAANRYAVGSIPPHDTQRLLGRMTAGVVHDFNNYLHAASVSLELMQRQPQAAAEHLAASVTAIEAMQRLNATLLSYARGGIPTTAPMDLPTLVSDTLGVARRVISPNIAVVTEYADGLRPILGVRSELEQVVLNLILNACDAMPEGGELKVVVAPATAAAVLLEVSDTGAGMAHGGSVSTKPGRTGPGLGLTIVRSAIARLGGALRIISRPSGGTTIAIMLPASAR